jgi:hypothetical protein
MKHNRGALQSVLKCPNSAQLKHVTFGCLFSSSIGCSSGNLSTSTPFFFLQFWLFLSILPLPLLNPTWSEPFVVLRSLPRIIQMLLMPLALPYPLKLHRWLMRVLQRGWMGVETKWWLEVWRRKSRMWGIARVPPVLPLSPVIFPLPLPRPLPRPALPAMPSLRTMRNESLSPLPQMSRAKSKSFQSCFSTSSGCTGKQSSTVNDLLSQRSRQIQRRLGGR